ncbi:MAG: LUD domain-containing protein [Verrucomicrobiales bacterium]|nr:LUD domain-containing protein [Verrucomicrobiales bacterium]
MTSRSDILQAVRSAQPEALPLPDLAPLHAVPGAVTVGTFTDLLEMVGASWFAGTSLKDASSWLDRTVPSGGQIASTVEELKGTFDLAARSDPHELEGIHTAVLPGRFGVCENGAIWLDESALGPHRVLPFVAEHLLIVLEAKNLVGTMHAAYERIGALTGGFGLFLCGPSKTADIEQCLVIGAHGARSCTVCLLGSGPAQ